MKKILQCLKFTVILMIICGILYPLLVTGIGQVFLGNKSNGGFITAGGEKVGSENIGQEFTEDKFFKGRVSSVGYNTGENVDEKTVASGSENLAPSNEKLKKRMDKTLEEILKENPTISKEEVPIDLITSSGSGLDPHISLKGAEIQIDRVSTASGISKEKLKSFIDKVKEGKTLGVLGEERVNVLKLNIEVAKELNLIS
ncbi:potassium-transporting ATPase subunit KdpC [Clostridium hydrogeniformans]|uniref:potassium-transporting ATPase subunit KdpC n=1 Tax=Clostridium hydrogeniformans TaxID=349933 RepID=UPI00047F6EB4|nr:potassium-transporting ATPase subunit KdpC [Clostridium hydrogeniformans]